MIKIMNLITPANGGETLALTPEDKIEFDRVEPYGYTQDSARCIRVDGRWYPLREGTPDNGLDTWDSNEVEAREIAFDAFVDTLPPAMRKRFNVEAHERYAIRKARRELGDAIAERDAIADKKSPEFDAAKAVVQAKRAALATAKGGPIEADNGE